MVHVAHVCMVCDWVVSATRVGRGDEYDGDGCEAGRERHSHDGVKACEGREKKRRVSARGVVVKWVPASIWRLV